MSSSQDTTCPKCGSYAVFHTDDGSICCQKERTQVLLPGMNMFITRGGGCGKVSYTEDYAPPMYRGGA